jgi:hypothetical protein
MWMVNRWALLAMGGAAVHSLRPSLVPRTTRHQAMVTFASVGTAGLAAAPAARAPQPPAWIVPLAAGAALPGALRHVREQRASHPQWQPRPQSTATAVTAGTAAALLVAGLPRVLVRGGRYIGPWWGAGFAAAATAGGWLAGRRVMQGLRERGRAPDPAIRTAPGDRYVSGGPASAVRYDTLAREGRRFVSYRPAARDISMAGTGSEEPVRVYVGVETAASVDERVDVAMGELERLGGFERSTLLVVAPAGSGYADHVAVEVLEYLAGGDCATVVIQYGVLPSMFSLHRVGTGEATTRRLLDALARRVEKAPQAPRIVVYGESLGARVAQRALVAAPSKVPPRGPVHALVSVGTPGGRSLREALRGDASAVHIDRWQDLPASDGVRLWFLDHDADPVARWDGRLVWRRPGWLRRPRGRGVPDAMTWLPALTWWQVLFDVVFAAQQQSGSFHSVGHDYRADLPRVLAAVLDRPEADIDVVTELLMDRERRRDAELGLVTAERPAPLPDAAQGPRGSRS